MGGDDQSDTTRDRFVALMRLKSLFSMTFGRERLKALLSPIRSAPAALAGKS
jgi:hypothetical protein